MKGANNSRADCVHTLPQELFIASVYNNNKKNWDKLKQYFFIHVICKAELRISRFQWWDTLKAMALK